MLRQHLFGRLGWHVWENRSSSRQKEFAYPRKMKGVKADFQEEAKHTTAAADRNLSSCHTDLLAGLSKGHARRIPYPGVWKARVRGKPWRAVRDDEAPTPVRYRPLLLMGVPPMHNQGRTIKPFPEKARIGFMLQPVGHVAVPVRDHAVG